MQARVRLWVVATILVAGCGSREGARPASAGEREAPGTTAADWQGRAASGMPAWAERGSAAVQGPQGRVFYGVGTASGIKNPALLRTTADNRGRAEIAKLFEVFSASLMKDYMDSTGDQQVEQAIKTMSSMSLEGVEVIDRYIGGDGTLYALAALRFETVGAAVQQAKARGIVKSQGVDKLSLDDIFDRHAKKAAEPAPRIVAQGEAPAAGKTPAGGSDAAVKAKKGGAQPAWVTGEDASYPRRALLCAVGFANERAAAENGAFSALSRIFEARVASVTTDFMGAYSKTGAPQLEVQSVESLTQVSTTKLLSGVELRELWQSKDAMLYALACMDRARSAAGLREQIATADGRAEKALLEAGSADRAGKVRYLGRALDGIVEREALNGELRIVDADGIGAPGSLSPVDVAAALE
ncbi:MAG: LPP20 family lipoprotein, partial [Myxococcota bacterium]